MRSHCRAYGIAEISCRLIGTARWSFDTLLEANLRINVEGKGLLGQRGSMHGR